MDKLIDYVKWMGELDFDAYPFREADALVLCVVSYFDLSRAFSGNLLQDPAAKGMPRLQDCLPEIESGGSKLMITGGDMGNGELFEAAARSRRFGSLRLSSYVDVVSKEADLQFAAVCFHYDPQQPCRRETKPFSFIAFRGTDSTLVGWKEDFMISFTRPKAQLLSAEYAKNLLEEDTALNSGGPARDWYIAGHSKGGNLAMYAACMLPDKDLYRVTRIFNLDGPGFCPEVLDLKLLDRIDPKTTRIVPEFEVIGKIFEPKLSDVRVVKSYRRGMDQHSLPSWLVEYGALALAEDMDTRAAWLGDNLSGWISAIPHQDREKFIDELFDALAAGGADDLDHMRAENFRDAMISLSKTSKLTKYALTSLPARLFNRDSLEELTDDLREDIVQGLKAEAEKLKLAEMKLPDVKLPEVKLPDVKLPDMKLPEVNIHEMKLPRLSLRQVKRHRTASEEEPKEAEMTVSADDQEPAEPEMTAASAVQPKQDAQDKKS